MVGASSVGDHQYSLGLNTASSGLYVYSALSANLVVFLGLLDTVHFSDAPCRGLRHAASRMHAMRGVIVL